MSPFPVGTVLKPMPARFWDKVDRRGDDDCWEWNAARSTPNAARHCHLEYGLFGVREDGRPKTKMAHRVAYELTHGPIPDDLQVLHSCDNPSCCNPAHLHLGTHAQNMAERNQRGRLGRRDGARNSRAKLTQEDVRQIRAERAELGTTQQALADRFGVTQATVSKALRGDTWALDD